jgi:hypothetical protein
VDKYVELMVDAHQEDCLWRRRGCEGQDLAPDVISPRLIAFLSDFLLRLPLANAEAARRQIRERYDELCQRASFLPSEQSLRLPPTMKLDVVVRQLPPDFFAEPSSKEVSTSDVNRVALALALSGWQGLSDARMGAVANTASCHTCLRRLGLWMFKDKKVDGAGKVITPAPMDHLDPIWEHRFFCPWKNGQTQRHGISASDRDAHLPGWNILLQTLTNEAHLQNVYAGRSKADPPPSGTTSTRKVTVSHSASVEGNRPDASEVTEDDKDQEAKEKERWARLKKVKSLFDIKGGKRLRRPGSRPGTGHSTVSTSSKHDS